MDLQSKQNDPINWRCCEVWPVKLDSRNKTRSLSTAKVKFCNLIILNEIQFFIDYFISSTQQCAKVFKQQKAVE